MPIDPTILSSKENGILTLMLNRPRALNSFNGEMAECFLEHFESARSDESVRVVVLKASGDVFCAGQDLKEALSMGDGHDLAEYVRARYNPMVIALRSIEKPVVCAVQGPVIGAGTNIALACDIVVASETATFTQGFGKIGLIPDSGGTFFLPRLIGLPRAAAYMMLHDEIRAKDAAEMGMIYEAVPAGKLTTRVDAIATQLATQPTRAFGLTKRALYLSYGNTLEEQLEIEAELQSEAGKTHDFKEGVSAFVEKRSPQFTGK